MPLPAASGQKRLSSNPAMSDVTTITANVTAMNSPGGSLAKRRNVARRTG